MAIPKILIQTYISWKRLPLATRYLIKRMRRFCPGYRYEFYDDKRIEEFLRTEYGAEVLGSYRKIGIGAAKADFFRYAVLFRTGGVYLDVDSRIVRSLDGLIRPDDLGLIAQEGNPGLYVQWALVYAPGHPFLEAALDRAMANIEGNLYPHDVHRMTGPTVYSEAIRDCLARRGNPIDYRECGVDYEGYFEFKHRWNRLIYLGKPHWRAQEKEGVLTGSGRPER
ncbi:MAG: glycosyltransferase [Spirochaetota bacterium]